MHKALLFCIACQRSAPILPNHGVTRMIVLGFKCIKSSTSLRITSDLKERKAVSIIVLCFGLLTPLGLLYRVISASWEQFYWNKMLLEIAHTLSLAEEDAITFLLKHLQHLFQFIEFSSLTVANVAFLLSISVLCFLLALAAWSCRTEIEFNAPQRQIVRRRMCGGRVWRLAVLPFAQLRAILTVENEEGDGQLRLIQSDGKVWAKWGFSSYPLAEEAKQEILSWLIEQQIWDELHLAEDRRLTEKAVQEARLRNEKDARIGGIILWLLGIAFVGSVLWSMWAETIYPRILQLEQLEPRFATFEILSLVCFVPAPLSILYGVLLWFTQGALVPLALEAAAAGLTLKAMLRGKPLP